MTVQINGTTGVTTPGLTTDTSVANTSSTLTGESLNRIKTYTAQATTSGTSIDFTGIPSWAKRVTINLSGVSTTGTSLVVSLLGTSSGYLASGYTGTYQSQSLSSPSNAFGGVMGINLPLSANNTSSDIRHGSVILTLLNNTNLWSISGVTAISNGSGNTTLIGGSVQLPNTLNSLRITTANGTDTFDNGIVNILVEG